MVLNVQTITSFLFLFFFFNSKSQHSMLLTHFHLSFLFADLLITQLWAVIINITYYFNQNATGTHQFTIASAFGIQQMNAV